MTPYALILPHPDEEKTLRTTEGALPVFDAETVGWSEEKTSLLKVLDERLGLAAHVRLSLGGEPRTLVLESSDPDWKPPGYVWGDPEPVPEDNPFRVPWARRGWMAEATEWLEACLGPLREPPRQIRSWSLSCVLRAETPHGRFYLKAATLLQPLFASEAEIATKLAGAMAGRVPKPVATEPERGWLLLEDFGSPLGHGAMAEVLADAADSIHGRWSGRGEELLALGGIDRRLPVLKRQLAELLADPAGLDSLSDEERARFQAKDWSAVFATLEKLALPDTLLHGDLHGGNVARGAAAGLLYFDWTDASVGCPYFDLLEALFAENPDAPLGAYFGESGRRAAWESARPLVALHHAMSYRSIERHVEPCVLHEHAGDLSRLLRLAIP